MMIKLMDLLREEASEAAEQAHKLGLTAGGWGTWKDETGNTVAKTVQGKLVKMSPEEAETHRRSTTRPDDTSKKLSFLNNFKGKSPTHDSAASLLQQHEPRYIDPENNTHRPYHQPDKQIGTSHHDFPNELGWDYRDALDGLFNADANDEYYDAQNRLHYNDKGRSFQDKFKPAYDKFRSSYKNHYGEDLPDFKG